VKMSEERENVVVSVSLNMSVSENQEGKRETGCTGFFFLLGNCSLTIVL